MGAIVFSPLKLVRIILFLGSDISLGEGKQFKSRQMYFFPYLHNDVLNLITRQSYNIIDFKLNKMWSCFQDGYV